MLAESVITSFAPSAAVTVAFRIVPPESWIFRLVWIWLTAAVPESVIAGLTPVALITAVSAAPGRTSPTQFTASRKFVPLPVVPPSHWIVASIARGSRPSATASPAVRRDLRRRCVGAVVVRRQNLDEFHRIGPAAGRVPPRRRRRHPKNRLSKDQDRGELRMVNPLVAPIS